MMNTKKVILKNIDREVKLSSDWYDSFLKELNKSTSIIKPSMPSRRNCIVTISSIEIIIWNNVIILSVLT
jgi:hypothetical protein